MARVALRPRAERDLDGISDYIAERSGDARAAAVLRRLARTMQAQAQFPLAGRAREDLRPNLRSISIRPYVIFYFPTDDGIRVARVLHGARDIETIFDTELDDEDDL